MSRKRPFAGRLALALLAAVWPAAAGAQGFNRVTTQDGVDVWAVGDAGAVYRSLDGGATWASHPMGGADHRGVAARGTRVWVVDAAGRLWTSTDGGSSFSTRAPAGGAPLYAVCFADDSTGWIAGAGGLVLKTTDRGETWTEQVTGTGADLFAIRFRDAREGWACGANGTVARTTDGGAIWSATTPFAFSKDLYAIDFLGSTVYAAGTDAFFAKSTDAGATWARIDLRITSRSDVNGVALLPDGTVWLCGGGGFLRSSADGGRTFAYPQHPIVTGLTDVTFRDALNGWACAGRSKLVARTTDGGRTWSVPGGGGFTYSWVRKLPSGATVIRGNTLVIDPVNRKKLYVVQGMTVFASWDVGDTWYPIATIAGLGSKTNAFAVSATDTLTWLALVQAGDRITRTTDGGVTWTPTIGVEFTEYGLPMEQDADRPDHVYFGPEDGRLWKSVNFGATWFELSNPRFRSPDDIAVVPDTTGVIYVGDGVTGFGSGEVWKSSDGGLTFTLKKTVPGSEIPMIAVSRLDKVIAYSTAWSFGGVQRTLDVGETWPDVASTTAAWGADIAKDDPNVALYAVYSGNASYLSIDRGQSFLRAFVPGSNYGALAYDRGTYFLHQSDGVYKSVVFQPDMPASNAQAIALLAPAAGEEWQYDDPEKITWSSVNIPLVKIEYQTQPSGPWRLITATAAGPSGTHPWSAPPEPTNEARMRVSDAFDGAPADESAGTFRIVVPFIATSRPSLAFGETAIGSARAETLQVVNDGTATLVVTSVAAAGGGPFTPTRTSFSVPPGGSEALAVVFEPIAVQAYEDTLVLACNAPPPAVRIPLSGAGGIPIAVFPGAGPPSGFELQDNAPNPFGAAGTVISYALPREADVSLVVFNVLGQRVATLVEGRQPAGRYAVRFPGVGASLASGLGSTFPSGVYFYRMKAGDFSASRRMILVR